MSARRYPPRKHHTYAVSARKYPPPLAPSSIISCYLSSSSPKVQYSAVRMKKKKSARRCRRRPRRRRRRRRRRARRCRRRKKKVKKYGQEQLTVPSKTCVRAHSVTHASQNVVEG